MTAAEIAEAKIKREEEKKAVRAGYVRIKAKTKEIHQNYRKAVTEWQRSGSGRVVCDHWEELKALWGGSPAPVTIRNAVISTQAGQDEEDFGSEEFLSANEEEDVVQTPCDKESEESTGKAKYLNPTPRFVDKKRKNMEKSLSASQRDQVYLNMAKQELKLKQNIVDQLATAARESNNAIEKIS